MNGIHAMSLVHSTISKNTAHEADMRMMNLLTVDHCAVEQTECVMQATSIIGSHKNETPKI